jgi:hypothetical protein
MHHGGPGCQFLADVACLPATSKGLLLLELKAIARSIVAPVGRPVWRRVWARIENRVATVETRLGPVEDRLGPTEARLGPVEARLESLETAWRQHVPSFLNAVGTVAAFAHELSRLRQDLEGQLDVWRRHEEQGRVTRAAEKAEEEARAASVAARLDQDSQRLNQIDDSIRSIWKREEQGRVTRAAEKAEEEAHAASVVTRLDQDSQRLNQTDDSIRAIWERIEFVRREILFEMRYGTSQARGPGVRSHAEPRIVSTEKVEDARAAGTIRLNLGCGHIPLPGYVNVDLRELPGVDIVAEAGNLPFGPRSVDEIYSAHLLEHFPQEEMRRRLLPYWCALLRPNGVLRAVTPDAAAMLSAAGAGKYHFEDFREVVFGGQDYEGDFHYNLFTPDSLGALLAEVGFSGIEVSVAGRRNGKCFEFEIIARNP